MKTVLTGVKPTGMPHIGNYIGAMKPAIAMTNNSDIRSLFFCADYHSLTSIEDGKTLKNLTYDVAATWLACGLNPEKTIFYRQSDVPEIFELSWILSCQTAKGLMNRAHAYKAKQAENQEFGREDLDYGINVGLFTYPILMAADILMFDADFVPVGEDQVQHVEIARDIAERFNRVYGNTLKVPKALIQENTAVIPGLDGRKMSKSYDNTIPIFIEPSKMRKLVMKIKTDSLPPEAPKETKDNLLFLLFSQFATSAEIEQMKNRYAAGIGWGEVKQALFEVMDRHLAKPREIYTEYMNDTNKLEQELLKGAEKARSIARPVMDRVRKVVGR